MEKRIIPARLDCLDDATGFVEQILERAGFSDEKILQVHLAAEEIFVNIASYAYGGAGGDAVIKVEPEDGGAAITFVDTGVPYDPLAKEDPDITLSAAERQIGGLGIFMVKKSMDDMRYERKDDQNILTIVKKFA